MPEIKIPLNSGIDQFSDAEEVGFNGNTELQNVYIDTPGKCTIRPYTNSLTTIPNKQIHKIIRWSNPDIPFNGFGWVIVCTDTEYNSANGLTPNAKTIYITNRDFNQFHLITSIESGTVPKKIEILENVALFTMGTGEDAIRYQWINNSFYQTLFYYKDWFLDIGRPFNSFANIKSITEETSGGTLASGKYYFYKVVPIFDGRQVCPLPNTYQYAVSSNDNSRFKIKLEIDIEDFNPRCSSIDVYRAEGTNELETNLSYYKIKSVSTYRPIEQDGGILDNSNVGRTIADNVAYYNATTSTPYTKDDWIPILNPTLNDTTERIDFSDPNDITPKTRLFMYPYSGYVSNSHAPFEEYKIPQQYKEGEGGSKPNEHQICSGNNDNMWGKKAYPVSGYSHNDTAVTTDKATDTLNLDAKIRTLDEHSEGDKSYLLVSRTNKIKNGHFMTRAGWSQGDTAPVGSSETNYNLTSHSSWNSSTAPWNSWYNFTPVDGDDSMWNIHTGWEQRMSGLRLGFHSDLNGGAQTGNNAVAQKFTLTSGTTYYFQYAFTWTSLGNLGNNWNPQYFNVKLTKPDGGWDNSSHDWTNMNSTNAIHYKSYGQSGYRKEGWVGDANYSFSHGAPHKWWLYSNTFDCTETGDYYINFWMHCGNGVGTKIISGYGAGHSIRVRDVVVAECDGGRANYYGGHQTLIPKNYTNYDADTTSAEISDHDYLGGTAFIGEEKFNVVDNINTIFTLSSPIPSSLMGTTSEAIITKGVSATKTSGSDGREKIEVEVIDIGYTALDKHPTHEIPINVKYEFSQYIEGRMFVADCRYTNENNDDVEQDRNLVLFSELNQPNVIPVTNYIKVQDNQGGYIKGLSELSGNLIVFMENSIWRLNVPNTDPSNWSLVETSGSLGCTSESSILSFEGGILFANKDGLYLMTSNFIPQEISKPWRKHYQENYKDRTSIHYCPKSKMLYINQDDPYITWVMDGGADKPSWLSLRELGNGAELNGWSGFMNDETSKPFFYENRGDSSVVGELEARKGNNKLKFVKRTGWIRLGDLHLSKMIRRVNIRYKNKYTGTGLAPNLYIWVNGKGFEESDLEYSLSGDSLFQDKTGAEAIASVRVGVRCKYFALEIGRSFGTTDDIISTDEDLFELLSLEVEWE